MKADRRHARPRDVAPWIAASPDEDTWVVRSIRTVLAARRRDLYEKGRKPLLIVIAAYPPSHTHAVEQVSAAFPGEESATELRWLQESGIVEEIPLPDGSSTIRIEYGKLGPFDFDPGAGPPD